MLSSPCHLVQSARRVLALIMVNFLHKSRSSAASLSSARFIPDIVCISSIYLFLGQPPFLLSSPHHVSIIPFSIGAYRLLSSNGQIISSSVLLPSVSATNLLLNVRFPSVLTRLLCCLLLINDELSQYTTCLPQRIHFNISETTT